MSVYAGNFGETIKEGLIKSARADCGKILRQNAAQFRRNTLCISRNCNKIMPQNFRKPPKTHLISASLRECRERFGYTQIQAAIYSDITEMAYGNYERAKQMPKLDILIRIADVYKVSLDYLVGRTDVSEPYPGKKE